MHTFVLSIVRLTIGDCVGHLHNVAFYSVRQRNVCSVTVFTL